MEPIFFMAAVLVAALVYHRYATEKFRKSWTALAATMDLQFDLATEKLTGTVDGIDFDVAIVVRGSGKSQRSYTVFTSSIIDVSPLGLKLYKEGFFSKVGSALGMQDIEVGEHSFDARFVIKCDRVNEVHEFVGNPGVRDALFTLSLLYDTTQITEGNLTFELNGRITNHGILRKGINDLVKGVSRIRQAQIEGLDAKPETTTAASDLELDAAPSDDPVDDKEDRIRKWARPEEDHLGEADDDVLW